MKGPEQFGNLVDTGGRFEIMVYVRALFVRRVDLWQFSSVPIERLTVFASALAAGTATAAGGLNFGKSSY